MFKLLLVFTSFVLINLIILMQGRVTYNKYNHVPVCDSGFSINSRFDFVVLI